MRGNDAKMKIDIFTHVLPPKYYDALRRKKKGGSDLAESGQWMQSNPALSNMEVRFQEMDHYPTLMQVLTLATPPLDTLVSPNDAVELAELANDEMCELIGKYRDRFIAAVACLPLCDVDAALREAERAITQLDFRGVQIFTNINGDPVDLPKWRPLFEWIAQQDLPIWIHPWDLPTEIDESKGIQDPVIKHGLRWPYDTSVTMVRLVHAGIFRDYPNIKFITHHCGGMVPFFESRLRVPDLHNFYGDTAVFGNTSALMCGYAFFGAAHLLFGSDMPLGASRQGKVGFTAETIHSIEEMDIPSTDKEEIYAGNAKRLLKLGGKSKNNHAQM